MRPWLTCEPNYGIERERERDWGQCRSEKGEASVVRVTLTVRRAWRGHALGEWGGSGGG